MARIHYLINKKTVLFFSLFFLAFTVICAQEVPLRLPKANWYNLDLKDDGLFGISIEKAYAELLKGYQAQSVVVAVIDGGVDPYHDDLKNVLWTNPNEIPGNGKDDDKNGYVDDIHGWNFMGSASESYEFGNELLVLEIREYKKKFGNKDSTQIAKQDLPTYRKYLLKQSELKAKLQKLSQEVESTSSLLADLNAAQSKIGKDTLSLEDFENFIPSNPAEANLQQFMIAVLKKNPDYSSYVRQAREMLEQKQRSVTYKLNLNYDPTNKYTEVGSCTGEKFYGNGNIYGAVPPSHGTHVAGIIAAQRNNNIGINGVADHVQLMVIRAIPDGHARGIDQANAIRYAADNGAKVINMSFGLGLDLDSDKIRGAIDYAIKKDILFICASGNSKRNIDLGNPYPDRKSSKDAAFTAVFIKVSASGFKDEELVVPFSNFGGQNVDVFAPGLGINSTIPGNKYEAHSGTSMAAPVVSGLAAVIREYYPKLTARQVKDIIMKSVIKRDRLKTLCISGGVVNAFEALRLAKSY